MTRKRGLNSLLDKGDWLRTAWKNRGKNGTCEVLVISTDCWTRCLRRMCLVRDSLLTGKNVDHRKPWGEQRWRAQNAAVALEPGRSIAGLDDDLRIPADLD